MKTYRTYLKDCHRRYSCVHCRAHLANHDELISKVISTPHSSDTLWTPADCFIVVVVPGQPGQSLPLQQSVSLTLVCTTTATTSRNVRCSFIDASFDFLCSVNIGCGTAEERVLLTGLHAVSDIFCRNCKTTLGWKYVSITFVAFSIVSAWFSVEVKTNPSSTTA